MNQLRIIAATAFLAGILLAGQNAAGISAPQGSIVDRNIDLSAEKAIDAWIGKLMQAPHIEEVQNIGILHLGNDSRDFTALLAEKLTALKRFHVVILGGRDWNAIEDEWARSDPDSGFGDIMDKATIKWKELRDSYVIAETAKGTDALLLGNVRNVDGDWLRARTRVTIHLARVDTREQVGGGIAEGESLMSWKDLLIYYKVQIVLIAAGLVVALIVVALLRCLAKTVIRHPR